MENHHQLTPANTVGSNINHLAFNSSSVTSNKQNGSSLIKHTDNKKPLEMNTYIQLEMDSNNFNCVPRVCKFCVKKINLQTDLSTSVILAVKLEVSKRSLRTVEIPIIKTNETDQMSYADLNLNYNITYPHFLKKDSNTLYFYIQRRKKYKSRTIMGYKTLAYAYIDLASVLQRSFSKDLPLYLKTNAANNKMSSEFSSTLSSASHSNLKSNNSKVIIGSLNIHMLVSQAFELIDGVENNNFNYFRNTIDSLKNEIDDVLDDYDEFNEYLIANKMNMADVELKNENSRCVVPSSSSSGSGVHVNAGETVGNAMAISRSSGAASANGRATDSAVVFFPSDSDNENDTEKKNEYISGNLLFMRIVVLANFRQFENENNRFRRIFRFIKG